MFSWLFNPTQKSATRHKVKVINFANALVIPVQPKSSSKEEKPVFKTLKILLVDKEPSIRQSLKKALELIKAQQGNENTFHDITVEESESIQQAIDKTAQAKNQKMPFHIIIMDKTKNPTATNVISQIHNNIKVIAPPASDEKISPGGIAELLASTAHELGFKIIFYPLNQREIISRVIATCCSPK